MKNWIADRTLAFDSSGIRKVFDLASKLKDPINLSIGQPDFDVPESVQDACIQAIRDGKNSYSPTQGLPALRERLQADIRATYGHKDRDVFVSSGTSGGLVLSILSLVNAGDEVIIFDPYFVMYEPLVQLVGGTPVLVDTAPDFKIDIDRVEAAITPRTKMILFNSPGNPTGVVASQSEVEGLARLADKHDVVLVSDEIYRPFCYDEEFVSPAVYNENTLVIEGFSKSHAMTGWRVGWVHGPTEIVQTMVKLQQYSFVCAPQPCQWAGLVALDEDIGHHIEDYRAKRDRIVNGIKGVYDVVVPGGAFYVFPKAPDGISGSDFVAKAIENNLLIIPGNIFSQHDTHFRISYAAEDAVIDRGIEVLRRLVQ